MGKNDGDSVITGHDGGGVGAAATMIVKERLAAVKQPAASVARIVKVEVPAVVGVPESTPAAVRVRPAGSVPTVTPKEYGAVPPLPVKVVR